MLNAKSSRQIERTQQEYKIKDREVKWSARKDKRNFIEKLASEAEEAAEKREFSTVYKITKPQHASKRQAGRGDNNRKGASC